EPAVAAREVGLPASPDVARADVAGGSRELENAREPREAQVRALDLEPQVPRQPLRLEQARELDEAGADLAARHLDIDVGPEAGAVAPADADAPTVVAVRARGGEALPESVVVTAGLPIAEGRDAVVRIADAQRQAVAARDLLPPDRVGERRALGVDGRDGGD